MDRTGPDTWDADAVLRDGGTIHLRAIHPDDAPLVERFHERQSPESVYFRFFSPRPRLSEGELRHFTHVDQHDRVAFVAVLDGELIGVARYERYEGTDTAEVAFFVDDAHHGRGLATLMLEYLAAAARENGVTRFRASTLPNNRKMLRVFASAGYDVATHLDDGVIDVAFDLRSTEEVVAAVERRERAAEAASVRRLLQARTIVLVDLDRDLDVDDIEVDDDGSPRVDTVERSAVQSVRRHLDDGGYTGTVESVSPDGIDTMGEGVDLVIVSGDAEAVIGALDACGRRSAGAAIVLSRAEEDHARRMVEVSRRHGMRLLGPGSSGVSNTDAGSKMHAMPTGPAPIPGGIGILVESGDTMTAILDHARRVGLGASTVVSAEIAVDVNVADLLSYWADDPSTRAVLLYLGPGALPDRFIRAARAASLAKPVVALHAAAPVFGPRRDLLRRCDEAMIRQSGVIAVGSLQELFSVGRLLADQPVPTGRGVAVVATSEGALDLAAAGCVAAGLDVVIGVTTDGDRGAGLSVASEDPRVGALLVVDATSGPTPPDGLAAALLEVSARRPDLTVAASTVGGARPVRLLDGATGTAVPVFTFPEHAATAISGLVSFGEWRSTARVYGEEPLRGVDVDAARELVGAWCADTEPAHVVVDDLRHEQLLATFRLDVAERRTVSSVDEAVASAHELGWPVVLKARRRDRSRRTALGGVGLDIADDADLRNTWARMEDALGLDGMRPAVVQRLVEQGIDVGVRVRRVAGVTTVEVGLGGPAAAYDPWELGVLPLSLADAGVLVAASSIGRALTDPMDRVPVIALVHRLAALVDEVDEVRSIHADPVVISGPNAWITDVEILLGEPGSDPLVRHLG